MALDETKPTDQEEVNTLPGYIRENRELLNILMARVATTAPPTTAPPTT
jgi:hypothetical protein